MPIALDVQAPTLTNLELLPQDLVMMAYLLAISTIPHQVFCKHLSVEMVSSSMQQTSYVTIAYILARLVLNKESVPHVRVLKIVKLKTSLDSVSPSVDILMEAIHKPSLVQLLALHALALALLAQVAIHL
jgi:hypothetical protein